MIQRREVRELVVQALYAEEISKNDWGQILSTIITPKFKKNKQNYKFAERLFFETLNHQEELDKVIQRHINNWDIERLTITDKIILRVALCEFLYFEDIPTKVTINEAIEIAKDYSTQKSGTFINGILDAALDQLNKADKIQKSGRGLIESSIN
ncbi:MAG: transcription antitermination factor NusB [Balneolaceae bacterium]|nr:transcription antitermination factor NusB [Balneolaceae bacterium]